MIELLNKKLNILRNEFKNKGYQPLIPINESSLSEEAKRIQCSALLSVIYEMLEEKLSAYIFKEFKDNCDVSVGDADYNQVILVVETNDPSLLVEVNEKVEQFINELPTTEQNLLSIHVTYNNYL